MKKLLAVLLSLALLMSLVPLGAITVSAASPTVYVGNVLVTDGTYLPNGATKTQTTKPTSGGYAYLSGSTLTLNNYSYTGSGMLVGGGADCYTAVYANDTLTITLQGSNTLDMNNTSKSYAIYCIGNLTVKEGADGGNLTIKNCTRGIENNGAISIVGGKVTIDAVDYGVYCRSTFGFAGANVTIKTTAKDGIYTKDALILSGNITITAKGVGISTSGSYSQAGGLVSIKSTSIGLVSLADVTLSNGDLYVTSDSNAISALLGTVTFSGGFFDIKSTKIRALVGKTVTFTNIAPKASTTANGSLTDYTAANIANYQRICYLAEIYVGGVGLLDGEYLANGSTTPTTTKPVNGYAYYKDGTLTLNNYTYTGVGYNPNGYYESVVYAGKTLKVHLTGTNSLGNVAGGEAGSGIWVNGGDLTITADSGASLTINSLTDDGIYVSYGNLAISGGNITLNADGDGIYVDEGNVAISGGTVTIDAYDGIYTYDNVDISGGTVNVDAVDDGIYSSGNATISGGTVIVNVEEYGITADDNLTISGGNVTVVATNNLGIYAYDNLTISGGKIIVNAYDEGLYSDYNTTISGGNVTVNADLGIYTGSLTISDGIITITADNYGIYAYEGNVAISGGEVDITGDNLAFDADNIVLDGVKLQASTTVDGALVDYVAANNNTYKRVVTAMPDVYVGGVGLANGEYLPSGSSTPTTTKPSGGYAYYKDGTLTLNNYTYDGAGYSVPGYSDYTALVYSEKALTVKLVGTNTLTNSIDSYGVGIWVENEALTIIDGGSGALNMTVKDDGIFADDDDINIQGGAITVTADDYGIYSYTNLTISGGTINVDSGNGGIFAGDDATISGGIITIDARYGICASDGDVSISGGTVTVTAEDYGIYSDYNTTISGGTVTVDAYTKGINAYHGKLTISGGTVTVYDCNDAVVTDGSGGITVSGGTVTIYDCNYGFYAKGGSVVIEGGKIDIEAECDGIYSYNHMVISGGDLDVSSTDLMSDENYSAIRCDGYLLLEGVTLLAATDPDDKVGTFTMSKLSTYDRIISACAKHTYDHACDKDCNRCGATRTPSAHKGGTATCKVKAKCSVCGESYGSLKSHTYEKKTTKATLTKDGIIKNVCKTCGYTASKTTTIYKASSVKLSKTSYTYNGKVQKPSVVVKDSKGNTISSSHYTVTYASGCKNAGTYKVTVKFKGNYSGTKTLSYTIKAVDVSKCKFSLSKTSYTYNGKVQKPTVTVKNASGTKLTTSSYTVTYASGRKNVGTYKVTVKMKGNYTGTKTLTFKINPPKTTVKSLTAGSKKLTVNITKKSTQVTGYQIQYSTSKSFKSYKTKTVSSYKTTKTTLTGLKAKTTYYVRIRTYKTVKGVKYYSGWSEIKYKKTK